MRRQTNLFDEGRTSLEQSIELTAQSINAYGDNYDDWCVAFSGGKDSSTVLTVLLHLIETGKIIRPKRLHVLYADTRQELPPLHACAMTLLAKAQELGCHTKIVLPPMEKRFWPYILGRGVPSPNNGTMRWSNEYLRFSYVLNRLIHIGFNACIV